jgi:hypothetical protein
MKRLGLINYEGDCLSAIKESDHFSILDQWGEEVAYLSQEEFNEFIDGSLHITDSRGKSWCFTEHHIDARASLTRIYDFLKS